MSTTAVTPTNVVDVSYDVKTAAFVLYNAGTEEAPDWKTQVLTDEEAAGEVDKNGIFKYKGKEYPARMMLQSFKVPKANTWEGVDQLTPEKDEQLALYNQSYSVKAGNAIRKNLQAKTEDAELDKAKTFEEAAACFSWEFSESPWDLTEELKTPTNRRLSPEEKLFKQATENLVSPDQIAAFIAKLQAMQTAKQ